MGASQARKQVVSGERAPTNEKSGSPAAAFQTHVYLSDILDEKRPAVKQKCPFAIGRFADRRGFINPYDRREISSSQSPPPRKASALRAALCAGYLNATNRAPQHRHHRWDKGRMTTAPASSRSSSFG